MYVKSITSGNKLPAEIIKKSWLRRLFLLPHILVWVQGTDSKGVKFYRTWMRQSEIFK